MIDTIVLVSPFLSESIASLIEEVSVQRSCVDFEFNNLLYVFTTKELKGTYDSSIRINIKRSEFVNIFDTNTMKKITIKRDCDPYLEVECSLHKFFLGHNILGGSDDIMYQVSSLIKFLEDQFSISLPSFDSWKVSRVDYAKVYKLGDYISDFFKGFSNVYYPKRSSHKYGTTGLYFPGTYTTLKLYDKFEEFKRHDKKKLKKILSSDKLEELTRLAYGILRIEIEIKSRKLKSIYGSLPKVSELNISDLVDQYNVELVRIFKVGEDNMRIYNNSNDVERVLYDIYGSEGNIYLGTWYRLSIHGYDHVKNLMSKATFYRHIKKLKEAGVSWNHTDVAKFENNVVEFVFNPLRTDLEVSVDLISNEKIAI